MSSCVQSAYDLRLSFGFPGRTGVYHRVFILSHVLLLQSQFTNPMDVRGVVVVTMNHVTSFRVFYQMLEIPAFTTVIDGEQRERVS